MADPLDTELTETARARLVDKLLTDGAITSPAVEAAFRRVPRHLFTPSEVSVAAAYADDVVVTRRGPDGKATSSVFAPWLQAAMLHAAHLLPGARVLEVGSGGYNAALIAEVVGPHGTVTSIDIDPTVIAHARTALETAGYPHVHTMHADADEGWAAGAPYDTIIVTVEASDIPPSWTDLLAPDGVLVAPLRMRGHTRCLTLVRDSGHLVATDALVCGFVPIQGAGAAPVTQHHLRGDDVTVLIDDPVNQALDLRALPAALDGPRHDAWSPVTTPPATPFDTLHLWLASQPVTSPATGWHPPSSWDASAARYAPTHSIATIPPRRSPPSTARSTTSRPAPSPPPSTPSSPPTARRCASPAPAACPRCWPSPVNPPDQ